MNLEELLSLAAPNIVGNQLAKEILVLHSFMNPGNPQEKCHTLFVGQTGTAKSRLLDFFEKTYCLPIIRTNMNTSIAGLVGRAGYYGQEGGIVNIIGGTGTWLADEIEKSHQSLKDTVLELMQEQQVTVTKQGEQRIIRTKINVIGTANPLSNRWDVIPRTTDIGFRPQELSRFLLILPFFETPPDYYPEIGRRMVDAHKQNHKKYREYVARQHKEIGEVVFTEKDGRNIGAVVREMKQRHGKLGQMITPRYVSAGFAILSAYARIHSRSHIEKDDFYYLHRLYQDILGLWRPRKK